MALLTLSHNHQFLGPFALQLQQVTVLIRDLQNVLSDWSHPQTPYAGMAVGNEGSPSGPYPPDPLIKASASQPPKIGRIIRPSRRSDAPKLPICPKEVSIFRHLLKNVKNHYDFMRFIGAGDIPSTTDEPSSAAGNSSKKGGRAKSRQKPKRKEMSRKPTKNNR